jgi:isoleucyl-tRNA synthetase
VLCHTTSDEAYRAVSKPDARWAKVIERLGEAMKALEQARAGRGIDNPLDAGIRVADADGLFNGFNPVDLADLCGVSRFEIGGNGIEVLDLRDQPRCERSWKRDGTVRARSDGGTLSDRDAQAVGVA